MIVAGLEGRFLEHLQTSGHYVAAHPGALGWSVVGLLARAPDGAWETCVYSGRLGCPVAARHAEEPSVEYFGPFDSIHRAYEWVRTVPYPYLPRRSSIA